MKHFYFQDKRKKSLLNIEKDITLYEIKPLSPTKLSISVKKFYNNVSTFTINNIIVRVAIKIFILFSL